MSDTSFGLPPGATEGEEVIYITGPVGPPGPGDMNKVDNLSGLADYSVARTNLGLGSLATQSGTFSAKEDVANKSTSVTTDQASDTKYPSVKSVYDWATTTLSKYLGDADFYQYSIVRTVASGNLTVSLLNFEGNTPTATKPVKYKDGNGVVRTISSALTTNFNAGTNNCNLGSVELATKEHDLFLYLGFDTTSSTNKMLWSRIPYATTKADFTWSFTAEKGIGGDVGSNVSTDYVVNIGRFNATLSAGAGYTWSIPATSVIVNRPIYETRPLDFIPTLYGTGGSIGTFTATYDAKYTVRGNQVFFSIRTKCTNVGSWSGQVYTTLPMSSVGLPEQACSGWVCPTASNPATANKAVPVIYLNVIELLSSVDSALLGWGAFVVNDQIRAQGFYNI